MEDHPPQQPKPTARDLAIFKRHVQSRIKELQTSARQVEKNIGMAVGTISKLYSGRLSITPRVLREIADELKVGPEKLVEGTVLQALLLNAPASPENEQLVEARREADDLRAELAVATALVGELRSEVDHAKKRVVAEGDARKAAEKALNQRGAETAAMKAKAVEAQAKLEEIIAANDVASRARRALEEEVQRLKREVAAATARSGQLDQSLNQWRAYASEREARVGYLESRMRQAQAEALSSPGDQVGALLLTSLASLGIGYALGDNSTPKRRR